MSGPRLENVVDEPEGEKDLVQEARELLNGISGGKWEARGNEVYQRERFKNRKPITTRPDADGLADAELIARAPELLNSMANELEQLRRHNSVQAESIVHMQEQIKVMREAIDAGLAGFELLRNWVGPPPTGPYDFDSLREDGWISSTVAMQQMRAAIIPKGEMK